MHLYPFKRLTYPLQCSKVICALTHRCNVRVTGKLNPHAHEVAHVYSPLRMRATVLSLSTATIKLGSEQLFEPLALNLTWSLLENGVPICAHSLPNPVLVAPSHATTPLLVLDFASRGCAIRARKGREYHLNLDAYTADAKPALPAHQRIGAAQFLLLRPEGRSALAASSSPNAVVPAATVPAATVPAAAVPAAAVPATASRTAALSAPLSSFTSSSSSSRVAVSSPKGMLRFTSGKLAVSFNRTTGAMRQLEWGGVPMMLTELRPNFWRAPVDNDLGWQVSAVCWGGCGVCVCVCLCLTPLPASHTLRCLQSFECGAPPPSTRSRRSYASPCSSRPSREATREERAS